MQCMIMLDLDEVLVNFISAACRVHGWTREELERKRPPGHWNIADVLKMPKNQFWEPIEELGEKFWEDLEPLPWIDELMSLVVPYNWHIVSSPSRSESSYTGKVRWLRNWFGQGFDHFILTPHKYAFARPDAILIDDREQNINEFVKAGGQAILFPSQGNRLYRYATDPLPYVEDRLINNGALL